MIYNKTKSIIVFLTNMIDYHLLVVYNGFKFTRGGIIIETIGERLKKLRESRDMTQTELAEYMGMKNYTTITKWEKGDNFPKGRDIKRLAELYNVSADYILGIDQITNVKEVNKMVNIPIIGKIACGDPIDAVENIGGFKQRSADDLPPGELFYLEASGDSMSPTITSGSLVLCRKQEDVETGEIAAVLVNGDEEATLKRVRKLNDTILLEPINDTYDPFLVNEENPARIVGKALEVVSKL